MIDKQMIDLEDLDHITSVTEAITSLRKLLDIMVANKDKYKFQIALYNGSTTFHRTIDQNLLQESLEVATEHLIKELIQSRGFQTNKDSEFKAKFGGGVERRK